MLTRTYQGIKNYTTEISVEKTVGEIEKLLATNGAKRIMKEFNDDGAIVTVSFTIDTPNGEMPIMLPARVDRLFAILKDQAARGKIENRYCNKAQAARTSWRIIKDWVDAQMALVAVDMVKLEEIFLPYVYDGRLGQTLFEALEAKKVNLARLLRAKEED